MLKSINVKLCKDGIIAHESNNIKATHHNNILSYVDEVLNKVIIEEESLTFKRSNEEYEFILKISEDPICLYTLKKEDVTFNIECDYARYIATEAYVRIIYKIETDDQENEINITYI